MYDYSQLSDKEILERAKATKNAFILSACRRLEDMLTLEHKKRIRHEVIGSVRYYRNKDDV